MKKVNKHLSVEHPILILNCKDPTCEYKTNNAPSLAVHNKELHTKNLFKISNTITVGSALVRITALGTVCILNCHSVPRSVVVTPLERVFLRTGTTARLTGNLSTQNQKNIAGRSARSYLDN